MSPSLFGRLGTPTHLLTALGHDDRADRIEDHLSDSGVLLVPGARRLARTSTATARMQSDGSALHPQGTPAGAF